jgi:hypothetical protein
MATLPVPLLQKAAVLAWLTHHYRRPRDGDSPQLAQPVPRRQLRREINAMLHRCGLPLLGERSSLWVDWFLPDVLQLAEPAVATGKHIMLVPLLRVDAFRQTLHLLLDQLPPVHAN